MDMVSFAGILFVEFVGTVLFLGKVVFVGSVLF